MDPASMSTGGRDGSGGGGGGGVTAADAWPGLGPGTTGPADAVDDVNVKEEAADEDGSNDAEGVWSPDIEQSFMEALAIYPPCGRRKIVLTEEGKMYGRNELIARYIKLRTGKTRTRKQVSSHMQVLARRKAKELQSSVKDPVKKERAMQALQHLSSAQIVSAAVMHDRNFVPTGSSMGGDVTSQASAVPPSSAGGPLGAAHNSPPVSASFGPPSGPPPSLAGPHGPAGAPPTGANAAAAGYWPSLSAISGAASANQWSSLPDVAIPPWQDRSIAGPKLRLESVDAFVEIGGSQDMYTKHHSFATISSPTYSSPILESIDISQIADKFPERRGLKDLFERGPQEAFFLVKFWADISTNFQNENAFYAVSMVFHGQQELPLRLSTKVCSFGKQVVEKVEEEYPRMENGKILYEFARSPMCDYMINFLTKLSNLPEPYMMNTVLENFSILQVATHKDTGEVLLCIAYVLEVSSPEHGTQHVIYKLTSG